MELKPRYKSPFLQAVWNRVNLRNKNAMLVFVGETGCGKSWSGLTTCTQLDPTFSVDRVTFSPSDFLHQITTKQVSSGQWIMLEELGVSLSSRDFWSEQNKKILAVLQAFRYLNIGVIFNVPNLTYIDSGSRRLLHYLIKMESVNEAAGIATGTVYRLRPHPITGKIFTIFPTYHDDLHERYTSMSLGFRAPPDGLVEKYELKKREWGDKLLLEIESFLARSERVERAKHIDVKTLASNILDGENLGQILSRKPMKGVCWADGELIAAQYGVGRALAARVKRLVDKEISQRNEAVTQK